VEQVEGFEPESVGFGGGLRVFHGDGNRSPPDMRNRVSDMRSKGQASIFEYVFYRGPDSSFEGLLLDWLGELEFRSDSG